MVGYSEHPKRSVHFFFLLQNSVSVRGQMSGRRGRGQMRGLKGWQRSIPGASEDDEIAGADEG